MIRFCLFFFLSFSPSLFFFRVCDENAPAYVRHNFWHSYLDFRMFMCTKYEYCLDDCAFNYFTSQHMRYCFFLLSYFLSLSKISGAICKTQPQHNQRLNNNKTGYEQSTKKIKKKIFFVSFFFLVFVLYRFDIDKNRIVWIKHWLRVVFYTVFMFICVLFFLVAAIRLGAHTES